MSFFLVWLFLSVEKVAFVFMLPISAIFGPVIGLPFIIANVAMVIALLVTLDAAGFRTSTHEKVVEFIKKFYRTVFNKKTIWLVFVPVFTMGFIGKMLPSQKELAIILAAGGAYEIMTSGPAKKIGGKALIILEQEIDKVLQENEEILKKGIDESKEIVKNSINKQAQEAF